MGRPQFDIPTERPQDASLRRSKYDYSRKIGTTVSSGFETTVSFGLDQDEERILESVSIRPADLTVPVQVGVVVYDDTGSPKAWRYARFPEEVPITWDPGVVVNPGDSQMFVSLVQESGADLDIDVYTQHRSVER